MKKLLLIFFIISNFVVSAEEMDTILRRQQIGGYTDGVYSIAYSQDSKYLAKGNKTGEIKIIDVDTGKEIRTINGHNSYIYSLAFSPDGKNLASGSQDGLVRVWGTNKGEEIKILSGHSSVVRALFYSPDGKHIASGSIDGIIKIWDAKLGNEEKTIIDSGNSVYSISFSPDGKSLASGGSDGLIKIWNVDTGEKLQTINAHSGDVYSVSYSPNGKLLASGGQDETIKVWNLGTVLKLAQAKKIDNSIVSVVFSPGGNHLISESEDGTIFVLSEILKDLTKITRDKYRVRNVTPIKNDDGEGIQLLTKDMVIELDGDKVIKPTEGNIQVDDLEPLIKNKKDVVLFIRNNVKVFENREKIKELGIIKKGEVIEEFYYSSNLDMYYLEESNIKGWLDIDTTDIQVQNKTVQNLDIKIEKEIEKIVNQETEKEVKKETNKKKEKWEFDEINEFIISHASEKYEFSHFFAIKDSSQVLSYGISLYDSQTLGVYIGYGITPLANVKIGVNSNTQPIVGLDLNIPIIPFVNAGFKLCADYIFDKSEVQSRYAIGYMIMISE